MTKPKLNIREMIRSGEIDTAKAGQLVTISYYTKNGLLTDSDERALRETVKDGRLYNAYMAGGRGLREAEIFLIALSSEAKLGIQKLAWIGAELKYTIETVYTPPRVVAMTEEAYERLGTEKRDKRLKRTYKLVTLYRILAENLIKYPETKAEETALASLKKYPEGATEGNVYGIDLIDPDGKGDVIEYWRGWIPYHFKANNLDTIADLAEEIPEAHALIMERLKALYKAKNLSIDPESVPLDKYHETELKGSELATMEGGIKHLSDLLNRPEHSLLDGYKDEGETDRQADDRSIFEKYKQTYAILKNPERYKHNIKDGILDTSDLFDRPLSWGYQGGDTRDKVGAKMPLETIKSNREAISSNLYILYAFSEWRRKAGELLGVVKTDEFKSMTEHLDANFLYHSYEMNRRLLIEQIKAQSYILPEYRDYTDEIVSLYPPIGDNSENYNALLNAPIKDSEAKKLDPVGDIFKANKYVTKALKYIEGVTVHSLADSFYELRDILQPILDSKYKNLEKLDNE